eukprot:4562546-Amphidinium_carterae.2
MQYLTRHNWDYNLSQSPTDPKPRTSPNIPAHAFGVFSSLLECGSHLMHSRWKLTLDDMSSASSFSCGA